MEILGLMKNSIKSIMYISVLLPGISQGAMLMLKKLYPMYLSGCGI